MRFNKPLDSSLTLQQIRGMEGIRVRQTYSEWSKYTGVPWHGRSYNRKSWNQSDPINRALSSANSCLYGICHAAIVALGYSPGLGFIHTGKQHSFVYDIADLYKYEVTVPIAFLSVSESEMKLESRVRHRCRDQFYKTQLLERIVDDINALFNEDKIVSHYEIEERNKFDSDPALPGQLWDPRYRDGVQGGVAYEDEESNGKEDES